LVIQKRNLKKESIKESKVIKVKFNDNDQTLYFSDGEKAKVDYDGEFKYKGKWFDTSDMNSAKDLEKMLGKAFPGTKFIQTESVNEEKVYIDYLNKAKGFKQDRIKFNSYEDAVKWARKNFEKFNPDMIKYESVNEENEPTNPELWDRAIAAAKREYDVYPSAYANAFASKWYKEKGGDWKTKKESVTESAKSEKLASLINNVINKVDSSLSYKDFAMAIGKILKDEYGSHLYSMFVQELNKELKRENESIKLGSLMIEKSNNSIKETFTQSIRNLFSELVPKEVYNAVTPQQIEKRKEFVRDLVKTLNNFYKQHGVDWKFADTDLKFKMYSKN
jgi:hypothetical protein